MSVFHRAHAGDHLVETIEKCSCMDTNCYRVDYFQSYWRQITAEGNNTTTGRTEKVELLLSVQQDLRSQTHI